MSGCHYPVEEADGEVTDGLPKLCLDDRGLIESICCSVCAASKKLTSVQLSKDISERTDRGESYEDAQADTADVCSIILAILETCWHCFREI